MNEAFGSLTFKHVYKKIAEKEAFALDYIFRNSKRRLNKMTVIEKERQIAFDNLMKLTTQLQTKRLRYNAKSACKYFTL